MKTLMKLAYGDCRYPMGYNRREELMFCAEAVRDPACSYCKAHAEICLVRVKKAPRRKLIVLRSLQVGDKWFEPA